MIYPYIELTTEEANYCTFLMNAINEDGGTPGFDVAAGFTLTLSEPSDSLPLWRASNIFFEIDEFCRSRRY
jgi:hypothetical protein